MTKQWFQISFVWAVVLAGAISANALLTGDAKYLAFSSIAAAAIAIVSIEHLISSKAKDTVRQQVYVSAGTFVIIGFMTLLSLVG